MDNCNKKLSELRTIDLRTELEKRSLDKTGVKTDLIERLKKVLIQEGHDPEKYEFDPSDKDKMLSISEDSEENEKTTNDSYVLMIETPVLDNELDTIQDEEKNEDEKNRLNSPSKEETGNPTNSEIIKNEEVEETLKVDIQNDVEKIDVSVEESNKEDDGMAEKIINCEDGPKDNSKNEDCSSVIDITLSSKVPSILVKDNVTLRDNKANEKIVSVKVNSGRTLWITNLLPSTRAQELKHLLSPFGKVIGAKIVQSSRHNNKKCFGYVTMETNASAEMCIKKMNNTKLKGNTIKVVKVKSEHNLPPKSQKLLNSKDKDSKKKKDVNPKDNASKKVEKSPKKEKNDTSTKKKTNLNKQNKQPESELKNSSRNGASSNRHTSKLLHCRDKKSEIVASDKIRKERECQRELDRLRQEEKRRQEERHRRELQRYRDIEKRQHEEDIRLKREREKIRIERENIERERAELLRLERERQKIEREKIELEKQELRRQKLQLETLRSKRPSSASNSENRKRIATNRHYEETPSPPVYKSKDVALEISKKNISKDYEPRVESQKRNEKYLKRHEAKHTYSSPERHLIDDTSDSKYESQYREPHRREIIHSNTSSPRGSKENRYRSINRERSPYHPIRDDLERDDHQAKSNRGHRYVDSTVEESNQYRGSNPWNSNNMTTAKPFSDSASSSRESYMKTDRWRSVETGSNERWPNPSRLVISSSSGPPPTVYSSVSPNLPGIQPRVSCQLSPGNNNFPLKRMDPYKNSWKKY